MHLHFIRDVVAQGQLSLEKVHTVENPVDMLTKMVTTAKFKHCYNLVGIRRP